MGAFVESAKGWLNAAAAFAYPEVCQLCGDARATPAESFLCEECRSRVRFIVPPFCDRCGLPWEGDLTTPFECTNCRGMEFDFSSARSAVIAGGNVREIIHRYKYNRALWFETFLAELLIRQAAPVLCAGKWNLIVPIPLHSRKLREREFNQAARMARRLGAATGLPVNARLLRRVVPTLTQTRLSRSERMQNVRRAFALRRPARLNGRHIVLVDDVFTTGATSSACARVLRAAGAVEVCVWTIARGI